MIEMTRTHRFRYDIGAVLRMSTPEDTGFRYHVVDHDFRNGQFGYLIQHNDDNSWNCFYPIASIEPDYAYTEVTS